MGSWFFRHRFVYPFAPGPRPDVCACALRENIQQSWFQAASTGWSRRDVFPLISADWNHRKSRNYSAIGLRDWRMSWKTSIGAFHFLFGYSVAIILKPSTVHSHGGSSKINSLRMLHSSPGSSNLVVGDIDMRKFKCDGATQWHLGPVGCHI